MNYAIAVVKLPLAREGTAERVRSPADAHRVCADLGALAQESLHVLSLDVRHRLVNRHMVALGAADSCPMHPREVFRAAVSDGASAIVLIHNHPSGDPTPSAEDVRLTRQMIEAGRVMGIGVLDHVIVARDVSTGDGQPTRPPFLSIRDAGLCDFS